MKIDSNYLNTGTGHIITVEEHQEAELLAEDMYTNPRVLRNDNDANLAIAQALMHRNLDLLHTIETHVDNWLEDDETKASRRYLMAAVRYAIEEWDD